MEKNTLCDEIDDLDVLESPKSELIHENSNISSSIQMGVERSSANISVDAPILTVSKFINKNLITSNQPFLRRSGLKNSDWDLDLGEILHAIGKMQPWDREKAKVISFNM